MSRRWFLHLHQLQVVVVAARRLRQLPVARAVAAKVALHPLALQPVALQPEALQRRLAVLLRAVAAQLL